MAQYQALYRAWRPDRFEDICGQEAITKTLRRQIMSGHIAHAYLFCGSRGTGKTTAAKVLARAVNCLRPVDATYAVNSRMNARWTCSKSTPPATTA